jgi:acetyl esterase
MNRATAPFAVNVEDLAYREAGAQPLLARLYRPAGAGPFPAVVSVHGGRWCAETRLTNAVLDRAMASGGVFVMAIDFRMPPAAHYPEPVADINLAIRWLKHHAHDYGIDPRAIGGIGTSSGGHQLLLNALRPRDPLYRTEPCECVASFAGDPTLDATLAYAVICWAVTDPLARYRHALRNAMQVHIDSHHAYWPDEASMARGSPQRIVEEGEATDLPPLLLIQGMGDSVLTPDMATRFEAAYRRAGGDVELVEFENEGHTFITKQPESDASKRALRTMLAFVLEQAARCGRANQ